MAVRTASNMTFALCHMSLWKRLLPNGPIYDGLLLQRYMGPCSRF